VQLCPGMHAAIGKERIKKSIGMGYFFPFAATCNKKKIPIMRFEDNNDSNQVLLIYRVFINLRNEI
jgi:hypothetical protein